MAFFVGLIFGQKSTLRYFHFGHMDLLALTHYNVLDNLSRRFKNTLAHPENEVDISLWNISFFRRVHVQVR